MDVRIGVLNHSIISHKLKNKDLDEVGFGIEEMEELEENWLKIQYISLLSIKILYYLSLYIIQNLHEI